MQWFLLLAIAGVTHAADWSTLERVDKTLLSMEGSIGGLFLLVPPDIASIFSLFGCELTQLYIRQFPQISLMIIYQV